jgi:uncharacterized protein (TIGR03437 family)
MRRSGVSIGFPTGVVITGVIVAGSAVAQIITTVAGTSLAFPSQPLPATKAPLGFVSSVAADSKGNVVLADSANNLVSQITPDGTLSVVAGNGAPGFSGDKGSATIAALSAPQGVAVDAAGNVYIADTLNNRIRKVSGGIITTIAGNGSTGPLGDGGPATSGSLNNPTSVAVDSAGNIYIADANNNRIRKVSGGNITTFAGSSNGFSGDGGPATAAQLKNPQGVAVDSAGNVYIADTGNLRVRKVSGGTITTIAGTGTYQCAGPSATSTGLGAQGVAVDSAGNVYIADGGYFVFKVSGGIATIFAGTPTYGFTGDGGPATSATLTEPRAVAVDSAGNVYIADYLNSRVRKVSGGVINTIGGTTKFSGDGGPATLASLSVPAGVTLDSAGTLYISDTFNSRVRTVSGGIISTIAGNGTPGYSGDTGPAVNAEIGAPYGVVLDPAGNIYFADMGSNVVRKISGGIITTVAGNGTAGFSGDGGLATSAKLNFPLGLALDSAGNLYISDRNNFRIRKVSRGIITTVAGNGSFGFSGDGGPATSASLGSTAGIALDSAGNLYISDPNNNRVRKVSNGIITTFAGSGLTDFSGDGGPALNAALNGPFGVKVDAAGSVYITQGGDARVRKITNGIITTIAGNGGAPFVFSGDGGPATSATLFGPFDIAIDSTGNVYVTDTGHNRIRKILSIPPSFQASPAALSFSARAGSAPGAAQVVKLSPSVSGLPFSVSASVPWLSIAPPSGNMPANLQVSADASQLSAGTYNGTITIMAPNAAPPASSIAVTFAVSSPLAGNLAVSAANLPFSFTQGASPATLQVTVSNQGSGSIRYTASASTATGGNWLSVSGAANGMITPSSPASLSVTATPGTLAVGSYSGTITVSSPDTGQQIVIPVTLAISAPPQKILLSQAGFTFTAVAQGGTVLPQSLGILNTGSGTLTYSVQATTQPGASGWLSASPVSGTTVVRPFLDVSFVSVSVDAHALAPGTYYGQVKVTAAGASNSPQSAVVVLTVLPAGSNPGPVVSPTGLIFTGVAGSESPGSKNVMIANITGTPTTFGSSIAYAGTGSIAYLPTNSTVTPSAATQIVVQPDFTNLTAGAHRAALTLAFDDGSNPVISILMVLAPAGTIPQAGLAETAAERARPAAGSCATKLLPQFKQAGFGSGVTVGYPADVEVDVVDDCGGTVTDGSVVVSFSNGDPPLSLVSLQNGTWSGSWQPGRIAGAVTLTAQAQVLGLLGAAQTTVGLQTTTQSPPVFSTASIFSTASAGVFAPGDLLLLTGTGLANGKASSSTAPLQLQLAGASVVVGGNSAPLLYADTGQLLALVPSNAVVNTSQQVVVQRDNAVGLGVSVIIAPSHPAVLTQDGSGQGLGLIYSGANLASAARPVKPGDSIILYCTGLGTTDTAGNVSNPVQLTIGGQPAQVIYAGAALAVNYPPGGPPTVLGGQAQIGLGGLYQVTATVPSGLFNGPAAVTISSAGQTSPAGVTLAVAGPVFAGPVITSINTAYGSSDIGQNDFIEIHGTNLAAAVTGPAPLTALLGGVSVSVNGKPALLYYVSPAQINALTPLDSTVGQVAVVVTTNGVPSASYSANLRTVTPAFLRFDIGGHITATHADGSFLGPTSLGTLFKPAAPGETIVTYAVGFGLPSTPIVNGSPSQTGALPTLPVCQISGAPATVTFAGINGFAGLDQLNLVIPSSTGNGDNAVSCSYGGQTTPAGTLLNVQR